MASRKIAVNGINRQPADNALQNEPEGLQLTKSIVLSSSRSEGERHQLTIDQNEFLEFVFEDDTTWFGNADSLHELFPELGQTKRGSTEITELPFILSTDNDSRSIKSVALKVLNVFAKKAISEGVEQLAASLERKQLEGQSGVYRVDAGFHLHDWKPVESNALFLLFLHGTASSTKSSFSELAGSQVWIDMQKTYGERILAFQHETLTKSPLQNVYELVQQLPAEATLHVVSHSRGGLVGDVLARFCANGDGFHETGIALLERVERTEDVEHIRLIRQIMQTKKIKVDRFVRVACPARGTSILSKRLDFYFNVTMNLVSAASGSVLNPVVNGFKTLIAAILESKSDVDVLPGLEAMCPTSPFLKVLNDPEPIPGSLSVISGNANYNLSLKALVVIVSKLVFKGANDFVVNTPSMYQGARREQGIAYFFDEGAEVNHFNYFKNSKTQQAIWQALSSKELKPPQFSKQLQLSIEESQRGIFGLEGGGVFIDEVSGQKPIVVILPGIMGSNISRNGAGIWLNYFRLLTGGLSDLSDLDSKSNKFRPTSLIKTSYKKLCKNLSDEYDVVTFPYDWRLSVEHSAKFLNERVTQLLSYQQPIKIIAHSMGGVLAREFIFNHKDTWQKLNASNGFRLLLLGTPWLGSYRIAHVFAGRDGIIKQLNMVDRVHSMEELIELFTNFPGILNLLPVGKNDLDFSSEQVWNSLQQSSKLKWTIPSKKALAGFAAFRKKVQEQEGLIDYRNIAYIAGKDDTTPAGYRIEQDQLEFQVTGRGDQSVTWDTGIPEALKKMNAVYYSNITHGDLANNEQMLPAIKQILAQGKTEVLTKMEPTVPDLSTRSMVQREVEEVFESDELTTINRILGLPLIEVSEKPSSPSLKVSVSNGDLMFSMYPVILGHFKGDGIVSAERVADNYLNKELTVHHMLGNYPGEIGSHKIAIHSDSQFKGACVVGLGGVDQFSAQGLSTTIERVATQYMLDHCRRKTNAVQEEFGLSVLLIGTDYGGLSVDASVRAIIQGIQSANEKISASQSDRVHPVTHLEFIELFEDRALQCFYALKKIMGSTSDELQIEFKHTRIKSLLGRRKRLLMEGKSDWWQRLTVVAGPHEPSSEIRQLTFYSSTSAAREEKKALQSNIALIDNLIENISTNERWTPQVAKTIFELLVPNEFKDNIRRQTDILWVLDEYTASYPWELFQTDVERSKPLCINAGMIRQLATSTFKEHVTPVNSRNVLVIGDPLTHGYCSQLAGAEKEATDVSALFQQYDYQTTSMIKSNAADIVTALFKQEYKMIHISAHGNFDKEHPEKSGMIIGKNVFLTPREFNQLSYTPELVFVNCCYLGKIDPDQENLYGSRYKFAANIGTQLIQNGVKVVIAAGWAVDDAAALEFARVFYDCMFDGYEFGRAVLMARKTIFEKFPRTNTWGAFQCYGDPFYKLTLFSKRIAKTTHYIIPQEAENDIDNLLSKAQIAYFDMSVLHDELDGILQAMRTYKVDTPDLLEKVAMAYLELNDYKKAVALFQEVIQSEPATYTVVTLEKYNNILAKLLLAEYRSGSSPDKNFIEEIDGVINSLTKLLEIAKTSERYSLLGSAYKRKASICKKRTDKIAALTQSAKNYALAHQADKQESMYSLLNWIEIEYFLCQLGVHKWGSMAKGNEYKLPSSAQLKTQLNECLTQLDIKIQQEQYTYWDLISSSNIALCLWFLEGSHTASSVDVIAEKIQRTWTNVGSTNKKMAEIEHLDLLLEFSGLLKTSTVTSSLQILRDHLMRGM